MLTSWFWFWWIQERRNLVIILGESMRYLPRSLFKLRWLLWRGKYHYFQSVHVCADYSYRLAHTRYNLVIQLSMFVSIFSFFIANWYHVCAVLRRNPWNKTWARTKNESCFKVLNLALAIYYQLREGSPYAPLLRRAVVFLKIKTYIKRNPGMK